MKNFTFLIVVCLLMGLHGEAASAPTDVSIFQLTVELRDGSRVLGQTLEDSLSFHSSTLGDIKLPWTGIRTIEYVDDTGAAHLTATNGDSFTVQLSMDTLHLETAFGKTDLPIKLIRSIKVSPQPKPNNFTMPGATNGAGLRLIIALKDGSRLVGKCLDDTLSFHSTAMGDLKLTWAGIHSITCATTGTDTAQLTAANGDVYEVQFVTPTVRAQTSFGKTDLQVKLIQSITVSMEGAVGEHLIGWWKLDDGSGTVAKDSSLGQTPHDGNLINGPTWTQDSGQSEWSLQFNNSNQYVSLGNILQGSYTELSIACWIKRSVSGGQTIVQRSDWSGPDGIDLCFAGSSVEFGHQTDKVVSKTAFQNGQWYHVVGTMSQGESGTDYVYNLYVDGKLDNTATVPTGLTATTNGWAIGASYDGRWCYQGLMQDVRIYDRALSADEVEAIYMERSYDKDPPTEQTPSISPSSAKAPLEDRIKQDIVHDVIE